MSCTFYEEKQVDIAQIRSQDGKPAFIDSMQSVSTGQPVVEYNFVSSLGSPVSGGFIENIQAGPVLLELCNNTSGNYSTPFNFEYQQNIDLGIFSGLYKIRVTRIAQDITHQLLAS